MSRIRKKVSEKHETRKIYLDNAAATPIETTVQREMLLAMKSYGNPSSYNSAGMVAADELEKARLKIARFLGAHLDEVIFTASGSEANNLALRGAADFLEKPGRIVTTRIEHVSVLGPVERLRGEGWAVDYINLNHEGLIDWSDFKEKVTQRTTIISTMYANNEIGTVEPIAAMGRVIRDLRRRSRIRRTAYPLFHVDACQAAGYLPMDVQRLGVDLMTFNGVKMYGPRGVGVLYVRRGTQLKPLVVGGSQEQGFRAGTENLTAIVGLAAATLLVNLSEQKRIRGLRDELMAGIKRVLPEIRINGPMGEDRLANNVHISVPYLDSEVLLLELDKYGIQAGSGSACTAHLVEPSHVLKAIGVKSPYLSGALRFSLGYTTTRTDIKKLLRILPLVVADIRRRYS